MPSKYVCVCVYIYIYIYIYIYVCVLNKINNILQRNLKRMFNLKEIESELLAKKK